MEFLETIILFVCILAWTSLSIVLLIDNVQGFIFDRRREKRELEYHEERMKSLK
ncbi:hypothetical protein [Longibaculum muris]|uniref:Uncharacterized protein n=1 Tax=Longibaculum muris TaxID=1796628 RepID=A0A4V2W600_9FIRM|nr:hypothetical protein [Longibaculum muris]MCR1886992.1 hypothetical protein [Longibaculum muris]TCW03022.1 hypothetical protein EDD60_101328 [Longibaculum muris]